MENPERLQTKKRSVWPTYFLLGMLSPTRASSSSNNLAPIVSDWLFLFRLSVDAEEKEMGRLAALLDDGAEQDERWRLGESGAECTLICQNKAESPKN